MRHFICIVTLLLLAAPEASAQFLLPPPGIGMMNRGGIGFGYHNRRFAIGGGLGYTSVFNYGGFPFGGYYGYSMISPILPPPIIVVPPPIIVLPPPVVVAGPQLFVDPAPPLIDPKRFIVISPNQPAKPNLAPPRLQPPQKNAAVRVPAPKLPVMVDRPGKPAKPIDLGVKPKELPLATAPEANPRTEADRQIELGKAAFALGALGRAMERFKQAVTVAPAEPTAYFLLAQAQFALGKYPDAVSTIEAGLKIRPDWPQTRFRSREVYGANAALFDDHLRQLRMALETAPDDPRLLFMLGVELWFDGKRDEATRFLKKAARRMINTGAVERFIELNS